MIRGRKGGIDLSSSTMVILFMAVVVAGALLYFLFLNNPDDTQAALHTEQVIWCNKYKILDPGCDNPGYVASASSSIVGNLTYIGKRLGQANCDVSFALCARQCCELSDDISNMSIDGLTWTAPEGEYEIELDHSFVKEGTYNIKLITIMDSHWEEFEVSFESTRDLTDKYLNFWIISDKSVTLFIDPVSENGDTMWTSTQQVWRTITLTENEEYLFSESLNTNDYKTSIKAIRFFTGRGANDPYPITFRINAFAISDTPLTPQPTTATTIPVPSDPSNIECTLVEGTCTNTECDTPIYERLPNPCSDGSTYCCRPDIDGEESDSPCDSYDVEMLEIPSVYCMASSSKPYCCISFCNLWFGGSCYSSCSAAGLVEVKNEYTGGDRDSDCDLAGEKCCVSQTSCYATVGQGCYAPPCPRGSGVGDCIQGPGGQTRACCELG